MKKSSLYFFSLVITLTLICTFSVGVTVSGKEFTYEDFWWLAGEADLEGAVYAPSDVVRIKSKHSVTVETITPDRHFIGNEPLQVHYKVFIPADARVDESSYRQSVSPFELTGIHVGKLTAVQQVRDMYVQHVTISFRLPAENTYDVYTFPSLEIPYEHEIEQKDKRIVKKAKVFTEPVRLDKVPVYVDILQTHDIGFISDALTFTIEIHADNSSVILNEYPPDKPEIGIAYFSGYRPREPFVLFDSYRTESSAEHFRVIKWRYRVGIQDIDKEAFELKIPHVLWQRKEQGSQVHTITPDPIQFGVRDITKAKEMFKSMKGIQPEPRTERIYLLNVPTVLMVVFAGTGLLWLFGLIVQLLKSGKSKPVTVQEPYKETELLYDRWPWQKYYVRYRVQKVLEEFQRDPSSEMCSELRDLLSRSIATMVSDGKRISVQEACTMTASELERLVGEVPEIQDLKNLDHQIETGQYRKLP